MQRVEENTSFPQQVLGALIESSQAASICIDGLSTLSHQSRSLSLSLSLFFPKGVCRVIYLNKPLDKKSTHDPSSAS